MRDDSTRNSQPAGSGSVPPTAQPPKPAGSKSPSTPAPPIEAVDEGWTDELGTDSTSGEPTTPEAAPAPSQPPPATMPEPSEPDLATPVPERAAPAAHVAKRTLLGIAAPVADHADARVVPSEPDLASSEAESGGAVGGRSRPPKATSLRELYALSSGELPATESDSAAATETKPPAPSEPAAASEPTSSTQPSEATDSVEPSAPAAEASEEAPALGSRGTERMERAAARDPQRSAAVQSVRPDPMWQEPKRSSGMMIIGITVALLGAIVIAFWLSARGAADTAVTPAPATPAAPAKAEPPPAAPEPVETAPPPESSAAPEAAPETAPATEAPAPAGATRVVLTARPPTARFFHKGKELGASPVTVDLPAGETWSLEVGLDGFYTRKVIVDGSKSEIAISLKRRVEQSATPPAPSAEGQ